MRKITNYIKKVKGAKNSRVIVCFNQWLTLTGYVYIMFDLRSLGLICQNVVNYTQIQRVYCHAEE